MMVFPTSSQAGELFLAILPDAETAARIHKMAEVLKAARALRGRLSAPERLHVTLFSLGGLREEVVAAACSVIDGLKAGPFDVSFDRTVSFRGRPGSRPFVLAGSEGVNRLRLFRRSLTIAFAQTDGLKHLRRRDFTPHVTLLFDDRIVEENPFGPVGWTVRDLVLIHSMNGHKHLARWPLHV